MEFNKLYNDDVLTVLKTMPNSSLDIVYGEPDYNVGINIMAQNIRKNGKIT